MCMYARSIFDQRIYFSALTRLFEFILWRVHWKSLKHKNCNRNYFRFSRTLVVLVGWVVCGWWWDSLLWFSGVLLRRIHIITNSDIDNITHSLYIAQAKRTNGNNLISFCNFFLLTCNFRWSFSSVELICRYFYW